MANIDVVPKRRTKTWLWIVAAIVVAVIVMALLGVFSGATTNRVGPTDDATSGCAASVAPDNSLSVARTPHI